MDGWIDKYYNSNKIAAFMFHRINKTVKIWNNMNVSKLHGFHAYSILKCSALQMDFVN